MKITCTIDNNKVSVEKGSTILYAAQTAGIHIPTLCNLEGFPPFTSCMICVVEDLSTGKLVPSCTEQVKEGMAINTLSDSVYKARQDALNLLLSEHVGECTAPCTRTCPAHPDIPRVIRYINKGMVPDALKVIQKVNPFPSITGHICPAPCEKSCRRGAIDASVSIRLLEKYTGDKAVDISKEYPLKSKEKTGKQAAIIGAGPAGLATAYYIRLKGHSCTLFEKEAKPGGHMRKSVPATRLPRDILDRALSIIDIPGIIIKTGVTLGVDVFLSDLQKNYDAVVLALGELHDITVLSPGLIANINEIQINKETCQTDLKGVFACGACVKPMSMAIRAIAHGHYTANMVDRFLNDKPLEKMRREFNSTVKKYTLPEIMELMKTASPDNRILPVQGEISGFTKDEAREESARCLHCDCYKVSGCLLRKYANEYHAEQDRYKNEERKQIQIETDHPSIIRQMSKCIKCGRCVRLTETLKHGVCFTGRGYHGEVVIPFNRSFKVIPGDTAKLCVTLCPTGALAFKECE